MATEPAGHSSEPQILIGPAGWSYEDWKGRVYPRRPPPSFDALRWIARFFDLVEVNASFYRIPAPGTADSWVRRVADRPHFRFTVKLHRDLTHGARLDPAAVRAMTAFLRPLREADRLGPLLAQFPWSFRPTEDRLGHLRRLRRAFEEFDVVFEVRHGDFEKDDWKRRLADASIDLVSVDQPQVGNALGPRPRAGRIGYVRLHGRNRATWFARDAGRDARYDYLYPVRELEEWTGAIRRMAETLGRVHVVTNNHFRGQSVINAFELRRLLGLAVEEVPAGLFTDFPDARRAWQGRGWSTKPAAAPHDAADPEDPPRQGELFS